MFAFEETIWLVNRRETSATVPVGRNVCVGCGLSFVTAPVGTTGSLLDALGSGD